MIKRMNKVTSLLVAAAAVASIIPATGVSAANYTKIDSQEGTIYEAVAYKDGNFYVDGNTKDGDTEAAYYLNDGNYTELDNIDSGANVTGTYGDKYLNVDSGDYFVDLSTGTVTEDNLASDNKDDAATALRKAIKSDNDGRYNDDTQVGAIPTLSEIDGAKFSEIWYETSYTTSAGASVAVYTDAKGNYIDADYNVGKIKIATATKSATLKNTVDAEDGMTVAVSPIDVIGQDSENIYRTATITVTAAEAITKINGVDVAAGAFTPSVDGKTVSFTAIQKISKAQASDDVDGAKYAKTVNTYVLSKEDGTATDALNPNYTVVDGKILAYTNASNSVAVQTIELVSSEGYAYTDITSVDSETATDVDVDADGNIWRLQGGYVYKFDNNEDWDKVYKVDGAMVKLSVYDQDNMVMWNEVDEVYSIVGNKEETTTPVDQTPTTPVVTTGWVQAADKTWTYNKADGTKATGWVKDGAWYFLKTDGVMATGWVKDGSTWYFLNGSGAMQTGWVKDGSTWYYLNGSGAMATGWVNDYGTWYYLNASGAMLANTTVDGYKLNASGAWVK